MSGDGFDDVLIGITSGRDEPRALLLQGGPKGFEESSQFFGEGSELTNVTYGGWVAALGDVNGDGYADFGVGESRFHGAEGDTRGRVYAYYGSATEPGSVRTIIDVPPGVGWNLAGSYDFDADGFDDIVVAVPDENELQGAVYIYGGDAADISTTEPTILTGPAPGEYFGGVVAGVRDTNGDGADELLITAPTYDDLDFGAAWIFAGIPASEVGDDTDRDSDVDEVFVVASEALPGEPGLGAPGDRLDEALDLLGGGRGGRAPEHGPVGLSLEAAVYGEEVEVNVQRQRRAKPLDDGDGARLSAAGSDGVERLDLGHRLSQHAAGEGVLAREQPPARPGDGQHPLTDAAVGKQGVDPPCRALVGAAGDAARAEAPALARERHEAVVGAVVTDQPAEAVGDVAAMEVAFELANDEPRQVAILVGEGGDEAREAVLHELVEEVPGSAARLD